MTFFGDDGTEMSIQDDSWSDDAVEALLSGASPDGDLAGIAAFVAGVRAAAGPAPVPSATLARFLATGISTDKGDLPATAASKVHGPARQVSGPPKWRRLTMKIKGYVAGLGVAAKVALGAGIAAAATTGAGAAGVLPPPVQHAVAATVDAVTPFSLPDPAAGSQAPPPGAKEHEAAPAPAPTPAGPGAEPPAPTGPTGTPATGDGPAPGATNGAGLGGASAPPAGHEPHTEPTVTTTTAPVTGGGGSGAAGEYPTPTTTITGPATGEHPSPSTTTTTTAAPTTTTTTHTESSNPESITLSCSPAHDPGRVSCSWTASTNADHARYALLRTDGGPNGRVVFQSEAGLAFVDTTALPATIYGYRIVSLRADGSVDSHSNLVTINCC